jgi:predicted acylesterase/phospholipase RssA
MTDAKPLRFCDIVMKGGITSGIVYPAAVVEIAKSFAFKNVGGTSAGAIAASLTAAAERRRAADGSTAGFDRLGNVPDWLAAQDHLFRLFTPNTATRGLFRTVVGLFGRPRFRPSILAKWCGLVWAYPFASTIGAVPGVAFALTALSSKDRSYRRTFDLLLAAETIVAGISVGVAVAMARDILRELPKNAFGFVTGIDESDPASEVALSTWLTKEIELIAGLEPGKVPLTFGMLWDAARDPQAPGLEARPADPSVNLEMITTNVTWGRPYQFPVNTTPFFFDPQELKRFFPAHVVSWMVARARRPRDEDERRLFAALAPKLPMPIAADVPVVVATRMSLAFPVLLSAVPLYALGQATGGDMTPPVEQIWFSDGGISSNFPVTLFDSPLPRWPTFGINLGGFPRGQQPSGDEAENVYLPPSNDAGRQPSFSRFGSLPGFISAIFDAMQNWNDNTQSRLPGYRDRIVTVYLADDEGGLNLDMPPSLLLRLRKRGAAAGAALAARFKDPSIGSPASVPMNWENHRWLRLRSTMSALREYLSLFRRATTQPIAPDVQYDQLVRAQAGLPVIEYPIEATQREAAARLIDEIAARGEVIAGLPTLDDDLPNPSSRLLLRAHLDS